MIRSRRENNGLPDKVISLCMVPSKLRLPLVQYSLVTCPMNKENEKSAFRPYVLSLPHQNMKPAEISDKYKKHC